MIWFIPVKLSAFTATQAPCLTLNMSTQQGLNIDLMPFIKQWQENLSNQRDFGDVGILGKLFQACIQFFKELVKYLDSSKDLGGLWDGQLKRQYGLLQLWGDGHNIQDGGLDRTLQQSRRLQSNTLSLLVSITELLSDRVLPHAKPTKEDRESILHYNNFQVMLEESRVCLREWGYESDNDSVLSETMYGASQALEDSPQDVVDDLEGYIECLTDLSDLIESPLNDPNEGEPAQPPRLLEASDAYRYFVQLVQAKFPKAPTALAERLGIINWDRYLRIQELVLHNQNRQQQKPEDYRDSALGTSLATKTFDVASIVSFVCTMGKKQDQSYAPPLPERAKHGPFECYGCGQIIRVNGQRQWRNHIFQDLQPYTCVYEHCSSSHIIYHSRESWIQHISDDHNLAPNWESHLCELCGEMTGSGLVAIRAHLTTHLEEISSVVVLGEGSEDGESNDASVESNFGVNGDERDKSDAGGSTDKQRILIGINFADSTTYLAAQEQDYQKEKDVEYGSLFSRALSEAIGTEKEPNNEMRYYLAQFGFQENQRDVRTKRAKEVPTEEEVQEGSDAEEVDEVYEEEQKNCYCQMPNSGEMIGCENDNCSRQWFHLKCLGMDTAPEGDWYCKECAKALGKAFKGGAEGGSMIDIAAEAPTQKQAAQSLYRSADFLSGTIEETKQDINERITDEHYKDRKAAESLPIPASSVWDVQEGKEKPIPISTKAKATIDQWFDAHRNEPYPTCGDLPILTHSTGLGVKQVQKYLAHARTRHPGSIGPLEEGCSEDLYNHSPSPGLPITEVNHTFSSPQPPFYQQPHYDAPNDDVKAQKNQGEKKRGENMFFRSHSASVGSDTDLDNIALLDAQDVGSSTPQKPKLEEPKGSKRKAVSGRVFRCENCGKEFAAQGLLKHHERYHLPSHLRPYQCTICNEGFVERKDLRRHSRSKAHSALARVVHVPAFLCHYPECEYAGTNREDNLERHIRLVHNYTGDGHMWDPTI